MGFFKKLFSKKKFINDPISAEPASDVLHSDNNGDSSKGNGADDLTLLYLDAQEQGNDTEQLLDEVALDSESSLAESLIAADAEHEEDKQGMEGENSGQEQQATAEDLLLAQLAGFGIGEGLADSIQDADNALSDADTSTEDKILRHLSGFGIPVLDVHLSEEETDKTPNSAIDSDPFPIPDPGSELGQLRSLLVGPEMAKLDFIHRTVTDPQHHAKVVSQVVTEALLLRSGQDDKLNTVLRPTVETIFKSYVRREPDSLVNQIFPVIGPAIRRSISETFLSMLQSFNSTIEMSFSLKGLKWRMEAWRTKKTFSEIVLLNTLVYRVDQIFLIHSESSTPLLHLANEGVEAHDSGMVSSMLSVIQDFFHDSFSSAAKERLETIQTEENTIYIKRSGQIYLACVVRGTPPATLSQDLQKAADLIAVECAEDLEAFDGNAEPFKKAARYLNDFLVAQYKEKPRKLPVYVRALPFVLLLGILGFVGWLIYQDYDEKQRLAAIEQHYAQEADTFNHILTQLEALPGMVVTRVHPGRDNPWEINCLKDNLAQDPKKFLLAQGMADDRFILHVKPYISLDTDIVKMRLSKVIVLLPTVDMLFDESTGVLTFKGSAPMGWILGVKSKALGIDGIQSVDTSQLKDPRTEEMESLLKAINGTAIYFPTDKEDPVGEDAVNLDKAIDNLVKLEKLAAEMQVSVNLIIYGHTDSIGRAKYNYELSQKRAKTVAALLYARGSSMPISTYGLGSDFAKMGEEGKSEEDQASRKIELRVHLAQGGFGYAVDDAEFEAMDYLK